MAREITLKMGDTFYADKAGLHVTRKNGRKVFVPAAHKLPKPTHVYIARLNCGCCMAVCNDHGDKHTANAVAQFIREGAYVERIEWDKYKNDVSNEPTFMKCPHQKQQSLPGMN